MSLTGALPQFPRIVGGVMKKKIEALEGQCSKGSSTMGDELTKLRKVEGESNEQRTESSDTRTDTT